MPNHFLRGQNYKVSPTLPEPLEFLTSLGRFCIFLRMYDAIIVGARCGGAATALLLARKGYKVLVIDRSRLPSDIHHGHFIHRAGPSLLHKRGLLQQVAAICPAVRANTTPVQENPLQCVVAERA